MDRKMVQLIDDLASKHKSVRDGAIYRYKGLPQPLPLEDEEEENTASDVTIEKEEADFSLPRKKIDWNKVVRLLAEGCPVEWIAVQTDCHRRTIYHALRRSPALRQRIRQEQHKRKFEIHALLEGHRLKIADELLREAMTGNTRALCFLAKEMKIIQGSDEWL